MASRIARGDPVAEIEAKERANNQAKAWNACADLAKTENILVKFDQALALVGLVGERRVAKIIYWLSRLGYWTVQSLSRSKDHHPAANRSLSSRCCDSFPTRRSMLSPQ